jgi:lysophospholipase L1-like esterase
MKKIIISLSLLTFIALSIIGCEDFTDLTEPSIDLGSANFSRFVSIGNSLTMGEQSSSVYQAGQIYSFGNIIAQQVGATYVQAIFSDPGTGGRLEIANFNIVNGSPVPVIYENPNTGSPTNLTYPAPYNNLGIKGAFLTDVLNATNATTCYTNNLPPPLNIYNTPNPLFDVVLRGLGTQLELTIAQQPTLITLWIGNNDILAFATRGGLFPPTSVSNFQTQYTQLITALHTTGAQIIIGGLPNGLLTPYFNTVGPQVGFAIQGIPSAQGLVYRAYDLSIAIATATELINKTTLITLSGSSAAGLLGDQTGKYYSENGIPIPPEVNTAYPFGLTPENPFPNGLVLDPTEIGYYLAYRDGYNQIISTLAAQFNYYVINWDGLFSSLASSSGLEVNGITFNANYVSGNFFSLDGIHPTSQGYGIIANEFITAINSKYGSSIPAVDVSTIPASLIFEGTIPMGKYGLPQIPNGVLENVLF